jgi:hypothetical protein
MRKLLSMLALGGLVLGSPVQAQGQAPGQSAVFKPAGAWALDYGDDYCRLMRTFSDGKEEIALGLERIRPAAEARVLLVGNGIKTFRGADQIGYEFLPSQAERSTRYTRSMTVDGKLYLNLGMLTLVPSAPPAPGTPPGFPKYDRSAEQAAAKGITAVGLGKGLTAPVRLETGALDAPIGALQACTDDLVKTWGVDPEVNKTLSVQAVPQGLPWLPAGTLTLGDFPKLGGGSNQVRLLIDAGGKPTACHVHWATLDADMNTKICKLAMEKATFLPAKDANGQAVASYWLGSPMMLTPPVAGRGRGGPPPG